MNENPYAAPPTLSIATNEQASEECNPRLLARSVPLITIAAVLVSCVTVGLMFQLGISLNRYVKLSQDPYEKLEFFRTYLLLKQVAYVAMYAYLTFLTWRYRYDLASLLANTITWSKFAYRHQRFWLGTVILFSLQIALYVAEDLALAYWRQGM